MAGLSELDRVFVAGAVNKAFDPATGRLDQKKYYDLVARHFGFGRFASRQNQAGNGYVSAIQGQDDGLGV